jgi:hypothetical protein
VNFDQSLARRESKQLKILGVFNSSIMQVKFVGMTPPWSSGFFAVFGGTPGGTVAKAP